MPPLRPDHHPLPDSADRHAGAVSIDGEGQVRPVQQHDLAVVTGVHHGVLHRVVRVGPRAVRQRQARSGGVQLGEVLRGGRKMRCIDREERKGIALN